MLSREAADTTEGDPERTGTVVEGSKRTERRDRQCCHSEPALRARAVWNPTRNSEVGLGALPSALCPLGVGM